jgi:hypothetical protein
MFPPCSLGWLYLEAPPNGARERFTILPLHLFFRDALRHLVNLDSNPAQSENVYLAWRFCMVPPGQNGRDDC